MKIKIQSEEEAIIHYKNGKKRYGVLIGEILENKTFLFIENVIFTGKDKYEKNNVEIVPGILIEAIELDLK